MRSRVPYAVAPRCNHPPSLSAHIGPAISRCAQGIPEVNSSKNNAAVIAGVTTFKTGTVTVLVTNGGTGYTDGDTLTLVNDLPTVGAGTQPDFEVTSVAQSKIESVVHLKG